MEVAGFLPPSMQLVGLDVEHVQCPPPEWLPGNIELRLWDVFSAVPNILFESFDVVIVRDFVLLVRDNDPTPILQNLLKLLSAYNQPLA